MADRTEARKLLMATANIGEHAHPRSAGPTVATVAARTPDGAWATLPAEAGDLHFGNGLRGSLQRTASGLTLSVPGSAWTAVNLIALADEHYLGFGERFNRIDQRGHE